jgi:hypothetical protein
VADQPLAPGQPAPAAATPILSERALGRRHGTFGHALIFCFVMM